MPGNPEVESSLLDALSFDQTYSANLKSLLAFSRRDWLHGLSLLDDAGLTLTFLRQLKKCAPPLQLPNWVQNRLGRNEHDHAVRSAQIVSEFLEFNRRMRSLSIRYLALKGLTLCPDFFEKPEQRVQYDYDFLVTPSQLDIARQLFQKLGYTAIETENSLPVDHLPTLIRKSGWKWKGNLYDPEIPLGVELHFQLWSGDFELIDARFPEDVWDRSNYRELHGESIPTLCREHALLYAVIHGFRHLLRNDLRLSHLYELGYFLERYAQNPGFWQGYESILKMCPQTAEMSAIMFQLSSMCFRHQLAPTARDIILQHLSPAADLWIRHYGRREALYCFRRSKHALFLHLDFLDQRKKLRIVARTWLFPRLPLPHFGIQTPDSERGLSFRLLQGSRYAWQIAQRVVFHTSRFAQFLYELPIWYYRLYLHRKSLH